MAAEFPTEWQRQSDPECLNVPKLGRIDGCTHPESAELLPDGEHIVFGNCAMTLGVQAYRQGKGLVYLEGVAFISLARIGPDRSVEMVKRKVIEGLTATLGCDILRKGTSVFPENTVFIAAGGNPIVRSGEEVIIKDPARVRPQAFAFDPLKGRVIGCIPLWEGSPIAKKFNAVDQPNGLAVSGAGDLYVSDIPHGNPDAVLPPPVPSAVYRIPYDALDSLSRGENGAADNVQRVLVPGFVNGVTVSPADGQCWIVSCSSHDPHEGALFRLLPEDFETGVLPKPAVSGLGVLDGVSFTRRGSVFVSNPRTGEIHAFLADGSHRLVLVDDKAVAVNPADINVCYPHCLDGEPALLVADVSVAAKAGEGTVTVLDISGT